MRLPRTTHLFLLMPFVLLSLWATDCDAEVRLESTVLQVDGRIFDYMASDLNRDGLKDLVVANLLGPDQESPRGISVFWQRAPGEFGGSPDQTWEIAGGVGVIDVGEVYPASGAEIAFLDGRGAWCYRLEGNRYLSEPESLVCTATFLPLPVGTDLLFWNFVQDLTPGPYEELIVPKFGKYSVLGREDGKPYREVASIDAEMETSLSTHEENRENQSARLSSSITTPTLFYKDFDSDGRTDILLGSGDKLKIHSQTEHGAFPTEPDLEIDAELLGEGKVADQKARVRFNIADLNSDGRLDIVAEKSWTEPIDDEATASIYLTLPDGGIPSDPDRVMAFDASSSWIGLADVDGESGPDIIAGTVSIGAGSIIKALIRKKVSLRCLVFINDGSGTFGDSPNYKRNVDFKVSLSGGDEGEGPIVDFQGDFNGDGRLDLAVGKDREKLKIYPGVEEDVYDDDEMAEIEVPLSPFIETMDLDGDKRSEVLVRYPSGGEEESRIRIIWAREER